MSLIKHTRFGRIDTELRVEAFNVLNHPQFGAAQRPARQRGVRHHHGAGDAGACGTCGTSERQIQFSMKLKF